MSSNVVRPLFSCDKHEVRTRVLNLYKLWCRQAPWIQRRYDIPKNVREVKEKIREEFLKNKDLKDVRQIDMLVAIGHQDYKNAVEVWTQKTHLMRYFADTIEAPPKEFASRFLHGLP